MKRNVETLMARVMAYVHAAGVMVTTREVASGTGLQERIARELLSMALDVGDLKHARFLGGAVWFLADREREARAEMARKRQELRTAKYRAQHKRMVSNAAKATVTPAVMRLVEAVGNGPATVDELAEDMGLAPSSVRTLAYFARKAGLIGCTMVSAGHCLWHMPGAKVGEVERDLLPVRRRVNVSPSEPLPFKCTAANSVFALGAA